MRSPLLGVLAALSGAHTLGAGPLALVPPPSPPAVVLDEAAGPAGAVVVPSSAVPAVPPAPPSPSGTGGDPGAGARYHRVWCPDCSGRGAAARAACETCEGAGKVWHHVAPPRLAKMTRQLQRAAHRAFAHVQNSPAALRARGGWTFPRRTRRSMARGMVRTNFNFYGVELTAAEVLRAL